MPSSWNELFAPKQVLQQVAKKTCGTFLPTCRKHRLAVSLPWIKRIHINILKEIESICWTMVSCVQCFITVNSAMSYVLSHKTKITFLFSSRGTHNQLSTCSFGYWIRYHWTNYVRAKVKQVGNVFENLILANASLLLQKPNTYWYMESIVTWRSWRIASGGQSCLS